MSLMWKNKTHNIYMYVGLTYLELAATAKKNNEECVQYLLERGADYHSAYAGKDIILFQSFVSNKC